MYTKSWKYLSLLLIAACAHQNVPTEQTSYTCKFSNEESSMNCPPWATNEFQCLVTRKEVYQCEDQNGLVCIAVTKQSGEPLNTNCDNFDWSVLQ